MQGKRGREEETNESKREGGREESTYLQQAMTSILALPPGKHPPVLQQRARVHRPSENLLHLVTGQLHHVTWREGGREGGREGRV